MKVGEANTEGTATKWVTVGGANTKGTT